MKRKTIKRGCLSVLIIVILALGVIYISFNKPNPTGTGGPEAEALAQKMLLAINKEAWDSTRYVTWTFADRHHYHWDKERNFAVIEWKDNRVVMDLNTLEADTYQGAKTLNDKAKEKLATKAWKYWCNDSFWFCAPYKVTDPGTERKIVNEGGKAYLLISYTSGGVTPGDQYLWDLDESNLPASFQMWVKILPIGGIKATWEDWVEMPGGFKIAQKHKVGGLNVSISGLSAGQKLKDIGLEYDPFVLNKR